jgi:membrane protein/epoxyqueuosine reductase
VAGTLLSREIAVLTNAIAFNFLLCLFPLLLVVVGFALHFGVGGRRAASAVLVVVQELIPFDSPALAESLQGLTRIAHGLEIASLLLIVWGSSGIFMPVEMALNRAWGGRPHRDFWRSRLLAFLMTMAGGVLALLSVGLTTAARAYSREWPTVAGYGVKGVALVATCLLFFLIYRFVPDADVGSRVALRAALWAGGAWEAAKYLFVARLPQLNLEAFYGPLALAVSLLLWAYVSSLVLVFGALMSPVEPRAA